MARRVRADLRWHPLVTEARGDVKLAIAIFGILAIGLGLIFAGAALFMVIDQLWHD